MSVSYVCVHCRDPLVSAAPGSPWSCGGCRRRYPLLDGAIPVLVRDPDLLLADQIIGSQVIELKAQRAFAIVEHARATSQRRPEALAAMHTGMAKNLQLVARWREALVACSVGGAKIAQSIRPQANGATAAIGALRYLIGDWAHLPDGEAAVDAVVASVRGQLAPYQPRSAVVMGAGAGRVGVELTRDVDDVELIDLSAAMALSQRWIAADGLTVSQPIEMNVTRPSELYPLTPLTGDLPPRDRPAQPSRARYAIADATKLPFADASFDAVLSIYLTDVVDDLPALLAEAARVLAPGGVFVHFGTLGYTAFRPEAMWTSSELCDVFAEHGLHVARQEWVEHRLWPSHSLVQMTARAWSCAAVKARA